MACTLREGAQFSLIWHVQEAAHTPAVVQLLGVQVTSYGLHVQVTEYGIVWASMAYTLR